MWAILLSASAIRSMVDQVFELDSALTEFKKVSDCGEELNRFISDAATILATERGLYRFKFVALYKNIFSCTLLLLIGFNSIYLYWITYLDSSIALLLPCRILIR